MVEGGKMTKEERNELVFLRRRIALGILIGILCFTISALIAIAGKKAWNQALENMDDSISYPHLSYREWIGIHESRNIKIPMMPCPHTISMRKSSIPQSIERHKKSALHTKWGQLHSSSWEERV